MTAQIVETRDIDTCLKLREAVFTHEQGVSRQEDQDGLDDSARHLLATAEGVPVGTARLLAKGSIGKIGRVCVLPQFRGQGLGVALIEKSLELFRNTPRIDRARLSAQVPALGFYEKLGFRAHGPEYLDAGILHRDMDLPL